MPDILQVDLQVTDDQADVVLNRAEEKIQNFASRVEGLNPSLGRRMAVDFELAERRADSVQKKFASIANTRIDAGQFDALTRTAIRAENRANSLRTELESIRKTAATTSNASILAQLEGQAKGLQSELVKVEALQNRIATNSPGAGGGHGSLLTSSGQIRGAGPLFRAAGLYQYGIDESILNVVITGGPKVAAALGTTTAALAASVAGIGALAAVGFGVVKYTESVRSEAEKMLKVEEMITGEMNKQILAGKQVLKDLNSTAFDREFTHSVENASPEDLQKKLELAQKILSLDPTKENADKVQQIRDQQYANGLRQSADIQTEMDRNWQKFLKDQEEGLKEQEKFNQSVERGNKKVEEMGKTWTSAFDALAQRTAGDNPFAVFLAKSQTETDKLKESLKGLPPELQKVAFAMKAVADSKELFSLRIDSIVNADNLRFAAKQFTDPTKDERQRGLDADIANFRRSSNSTNPDAFRFFQQRQSDSDNYDRDQRNRLLEEEFRDIYDTRRKGFDLGIADRKFNGLTQGLNAGDLPDNLRRAASDSRLREAGRQEKAEQDAQNERIKQTGIQAELLDVQKQLLKATNAGGEQALKVILKNETDGKYTATATASNDDVASKYQFDGFGLAGGSNY